MLDALHDADLRLVVCRHEGGAANMAEAYGKLTGRPGVCLVTRGPGATHASIGVHTAFQDSTPMLLLVGQVARGHVGREGFQELDYRQVFGPVAKWVDADRRRRARPGGRSPARSRVATSGRPGPVVVALPEDMLVEEADVGDARPFVPATSGPGVAGLERVQALLAAARQPLIVVGEGGWTAQAGADVMAFAEASGIPVAASWRCQDYVDNTSPAYAGHAGLAIAPPLAQRIRDADVLLLLGGRFGEVPSGGYSLLDVPAPAQRLIHVHPDPDELGAVYQPEVGIVSALAPFAAALRALDCPPDGLRDGLIAAAHADHERFLADVRELPGALQMTDVMAVLRERLPPDAILTSGAGNFTVWAHRFYAFTRYPTQLAPRSGAMGYGVPAAVAAKALHPDRVVVCLAGDGDFLMTGQELATAVQHDLPIVVLVVNNGMYGTIRMHQERAYPGRVVGTDLVNPDFAAYARAFGAHGAIVERSEDFAGAFEDGARERSSRPDRAARGPRGDHPAPDADGAAGVNGMATADPRPGTEAGVREALDALEAHDGLNAVITLCRDEALARARTGTVAGRLAGVALVVKDLIDTAGVRTTYASRLHAEHVPDRSAPAVAALEAEGAIVVAKTNADEFAWGATGQNPVFGDVVNPRRPGRIAGGSSGGNAAVLAAGLVPLALGTDTGGSVRMPAAACGVVGLKPALGEVSVAGVHPLAPSYDTVGPMARTVRECALAHAVLSGTPLVAPRASLAGLRVGVLTAPPDLTGQAGAAGGRDPRADVVLALFAASRRPRARGRAAVSRGRHLADLRRRGGGRARRDVPLLRGRLRPHDPGQARRGAGRRPRRPRRRVPRPGGLAHGGGHRPGRRRHRVPDARSRRAPAGRGRRARGASRALGLHPAVQHPRLAGDRHRRAAAGRPRQPHAARRGPRARARRRSRREPAGRTCG